MNFFVISVAAAGNDEISLTLELSSEGHSHREKFLISADAYAGLHISKGECTKELYELLEHEAAVWSAFKRGLYILGYGSCSQKRLVQKLVQKGFLRNIAEEAADRINAGGFLDENASALREAEVCLGKLWGERRIRAQLFSKGYTKESIDEAMYALEDQGTDYTKNCAQLILKKCGALPKERDTRQKLISSLMRYGYDMSQIKRAFELVSSC